MESTSAALQVPTGPNGMTEPVRTPQQQPVADQQAVRETMARYKAASDFDRPFKDKALRAWQNLHNVLPYNWPFWSTHFEPETQVTANETVEQMMQGLFAKENYFDLRPLKGQTRLMTEITKELMRFVLRKAKYKQTKYRQMTECVSYGNGVEFHYVQPRVVKDHQRVPMADEFGVPAGYQDSINQSLEFWPKSKVISRFDCYPSVTGASIQEMPYFIHREMVPMAAVQTLAWPGFKNVDCLKGFLMIDPIRGRVGLDDYDLAYDLYERLRAVGLNVMEGLSNVRGDGCTEYVELLYEFSAPTNDEGCGHWRILGNRSVLLLDQEWPFWHAKKPYSEIKYLERSPNLWQADGLPALIEPLQVKLNLRSNQASDAIVQHNRPMALYDPVKSGIEDSTLLDHWPDRKIAVNDTSEGAVRFLERPEVTQDLFADLDMTRASIQRVAKLFDATRNISGARSGVGEAAKTATGLSMITNMMRQSVTFKVLLAEETGFAEGLGIYLAMVQQVLTQDQKLAIEDTSNPEFQQAGIQDQLTVTPMDVQGEYDIIIVGSSRSMEDAESIAAFDDWIKEGLMLPQVAPLIKQMDAWLYKGEVLNVPSPRRFIMTAAEHMEQQQQQLQQAVQTHALLGAAAATGAVAGAATGPAGQPGGPAGAPGVGTNVA